MELPYEELLGWMEYFRRRPVGWRDDNRAAVIAMSSFGAGKIKPEDMFESLRVIKRETQKVEEAEAGSNFARKFLDKFGAKLSEGNPFKDAKD